MQNKRNFLRPPRGRLLWARVPTRLADYVRPRERGARGIWSTNQWYVFNIFFLTIILSIFYFMSGIDSLFLSCKGGIVEYGFSILALTNFGEFHCVLHFNDKNFNVLN